MDAHIHSRVDQLLLEQGEYIPLELLLAEGWLEYGDYARWREGATETLDGHLSGDPSELQQELTWAAAYARDLKLEELPLEYTAWSGGAPLRFSRDPVLEALFHRGYHKGSNVLQMDLFMDSPGTTLANTVQLALEQGDSGAAAEALDKLYRVDPGHSRLGGLERLVEAARTIDRPVTAPQQALDSLEALWSPACELLGRDGARRFVAPGWRRLGEALAGRPFDPATPQLHSSHVAARLLDWGAAAAAVEAEPEWRGQPLLLLRHAVACDRLRRPVEALLDRCVLCWEHPDGVSAAMQEAPPELVRPWERFLGLDPELEVPCFPAWLLIVRPPMAGWLPLPEDAPQGFRLVHALQRLTGGGAAPDPEALRLRGELKSLHPGLFRHYVANLPR